jgi:DNA-binding MarR family transcriptional regulator
MSGSDLAAITGLTTGAITGVVAKLEEAGFLHRQPDPHDGRKQILKAAPEGMQHIHAVFGPLRKDMAELLDSFDADRHMALLRSDTQHRKPGSRSSRSQL